MGDTVGRPTPISRSGDVPGRPPRAVPLDAGRSVSPLASILTYTGWTPDNQTQGWWVSFTFLFKNSLFEARVTASPCYSCS